MSMKKTEGGVTAAKGFLAASTAAGIKKNGSMDMAMIYSEVPCVAAGTFTTNVVKAAPVKWDRKIVYDYPTAQAIVCNSGIANACTGTEGYNYCEKTAQAAGECLNIEKYSVLVASTGVIGQQLPMGKLEAGVRAMATKLDNSLVAGTAAAEAIMTTDTRKKEIAVSVEIGGKEVVIGGMCKGSGMIHPNMATMLGFITTDLNISKDLLNKALKSVIPDTFNMISVDRDTSTNDTVLLLANGLAGNDEITEENEDYQIFKEALYYVNEYLAKCIAGDGEGATKLLEVNVKGAKDVKQAKVVAKSVCTSPLVKTAIYGNDANWGRLLCAMGYSGEEFDPYQVDLFIESEFGNLQLVENGMATDYSEEFATKILSSEYVKANINMKIADGKATAWGCDLTYDYVKINADYRS